MRCPFCGVENPDDAMFCGNCGKGFYGQAPPKTKTDNKIVWIIVAVVIALVVVPIVLSAILYVMVLGVGPPVDGMVPVIGTTKGSTASDTTWTVTAISGSASVLKADVYVQVKDAGGTFTITTESLLYATGTHEFNYSSASTGSYLSIGDVFSLNKVIYTQGSTITLVTASASAQYCIMTV